VKTAGSAVTTGNYFYDPNGNQLAKATETLTPAGAGSAQVGIDPSGVELYDYDGFNRMVRSNVNGEVAEYTYRADGLRNSKETAVGKTTHLWDCSNIVADMDGSVIASRYMRGIGLILSDEGTATAQKFYLYNGHGDVVQLTSSGGVILWEYDYDAFGVERNPDPADTNPWRYCGEYFDKETGSIYLRARYYNPVLGRFRTEDPIRDGLNWYVYAGDNPLFYLDPFGLWPIPIRHFVAMYAKHGGDLSCDNERRFSVFEVGGIKLATTYAGYNLHGIDIWNESGHLWADTNQLYDYFQADRFIPTMAEELLKKDPLGTTIIFGGSLVIAAGGHAAIGAFAASPAAATIAGGANQVAQRAAPPVTAVIGSHPEYVVRAQQIGARFYQVPPHIWEKMTPVAREAANIKFLDRAIAAGAHFIIESANAVANYGPGLRMEIEYLLNAGYIFVENGTKLIPGI
jgi:RHS repeat-associated protein